MVFMIHDAYARTSLHLTAHVQHMWAFLWASLVHLDRFGISIMQTETEIGRIVSELVHFVSMKVLHTFV